MPKIKPQEWGKKEVLGSRASQYRYRQAHFIEQCINHELWVKCGHYFFRFPSSEKQSNLLTEMVCNFLSWSNWKPNRIDVKGTARIHSYEKFDVVSGKTQKMQSVQFTPTKTNKGTADINAKYVLPNFVISWDIEIKAGKDRMSEAQKAEQAKFGEWYSVVRNMDEFFYHYDHRMKIVNQMKGLQLF